MANIIYDLEELANPTFECYYGTTVHINVSVKPLDMYLQSGVSSHTSLISSSGSSHSYARSFFLALL